MLATTGQSGMHGAAPVYRDRVRLPLRFDAARMQTDVATIIDGGWTPHFVRQNYDGDWSAIPLRICAGASDKHPIMQIYADPAATRFEDGPLLARTPYLREVLAAIPCAVQTVRLMKLAAGSAIKPHRDDDLAIEHGFARLHIPVATNRQVDFRLNGVRVAMAAGSVWYLRLSDTHSVANRGRTDRIHLVLDCVADDWLRGLVAG